MQYTKTQLENGLTLITVPQAGSVSTTVLVLVHTGSKYETKETNGLSHFLEHVVFKGTEKRLKAMDISLEFDTMGSQNNAFTSLEFTGYYGKAHPSHFEKILDLVSDVYLHPTLPEGEIEKERGVIIEEINMYEDMPHRAVQELFMSTLYGDQPAGWDTLGPKENILKFRREDFLAYRKAHYVAEATTVVVAGDIDEATVKEKVEAAFAEISTSAKEKKVPVIDTQDSPLLTVKEKDTDQTHFVLGVRTFDANDERNYALKVLNTILSGGMSSRLWQKLREEMGVGYYVRSSVDDYTDHGVLSVSAGVDSSRLHEVVQAVLAEMRRLATEDVSLEELNKAKEYYIGTMYLGLESSDSIAEYYGLQDIVSRDLLSPRDMEQKIRMVTSSDIRSLAEFLMTDDRMALAVIGNGVNETLLRNNLSFNK